MEQINGQLKNQYLTFELVNETFAVNIGMVREVLDFTDITKVPRTPDFMCGVINLRGSVVAVVDFGFNLGIGKTAHRSSTCIIILEVELESEMITVGVLADAVREVIEIASASIQETPEYGTKLNTDFMKGVGKKGKASVMLLDVPKVLSANVEIMESTANRSVASRGSLAEMQA